MKISINYLIVGAIVSYVGIKTGFGPVSVVTGLIYLLLGFGLRPINRFTFLSTLCIYLSILNFAIVYYINTQEELELAAIYFMSPTFVLLPLSLLLLVAGIISPLFKKNR